MKYLACYPSGKLVSNRVFTTETEALETVAKHAPDGGFAKPVFTERPNIRDVMRSAAKRSAKPKRHLQREALVGRTLRKIARAGYDA